MSINGRSLGWRLDVGKRRSRSGLAAGDPRCLSRLGDTQGGHQQSQRSRYCGTSCWREIKVTVAALLRVLWLGRALNSARHRDHFYIYIYIYNIALGSACLWFVYLEFCSYS